jgi:HSP90 family molecular chaperone
MDCQKRGGQWIVSWPQDLKDMINMDSRTPATHYIKIQTSISEFDLCVKEGHHDDDCSKIHLLDGGRCAILVWAKKWLKEDCAKMKDMVQIYHEQRANDIAHWPTYVQQAMYQDPFFEAYKKRYYDVIYNPDSNGPDTMSIEWCNQTCGNVSDRGRELVTLY